MALAMHPQEIGKPYFGHDEPPTSGTQTGSTGGGWTATDWCNAQPTVLQRAACLEANKTGEPPAIKSGVLVGTGIFGTVVGGGTTRIPSECLNLPPLEYKLCVSRNAPNTGDEAWIMGASSGGGDESPSQPQQSRALNVGNGLNGLLKLFGIKPRPSPTTQPSLRGKVPTGNPLIGSPLYPSRGGDTVCAEIYSPVCGVDGKTYSNDCYASRAGVRVLFGGECITPESEGLSVFSESPRPVRKCRVRKEAVLCNIGPFDCTAYTNIADRPECATRTTCLRGE